MYDVISTNLLRTLGSPAYFQTTAVLESLFTKRIIYSPRSGIDENLMGASEAGECFLGTLATIFRSLLVRMKNES